MELRHDDALRARLEEAAATIQAAFRRKHVQKITRTLRSARQAENNSPQRILAAADKAWAERQRLMRQPGYVGFDQPRPTSPRRQKVSANMTKHEILMSGDLRVMTERERPWGFGPDGPSDKEIVQEVIERRTRVDIARSKAKKKKGRRKTFRELSKSSPSSLGLPKASTADRTRPRDNTIGAADSSTGESSTTESGSSSHASDEDYGATQTTADGKTLEEKQPEPKVETATDGKENLALEQAVPMPPQTHALLDEQAALEA